MLNMLLPKPMAKSQLYTPFLPFPLPPPPPKKTKPKTKQQKSKLDFVFNYLDRKLIQNLK